MSDHFRLELPAVVSFSGGRTSGYLLRHILDAHGGQPPGLKVGFQNTGLEAEETLAFVQECSERWRCEITWTEYTVNADNKPDFEVVSFETASRKGEPFNRLIAKKQYLPNPVARLCSEQLKVRTMKRWLKTVPGFEDGYTNAVGLRADEPHRAVRVLADEQRDMACPLYRAGVTNDDVLDFWSTNDFDLNLPTSGIRSNCQGCFLKSRSKLEVLMKESPEHFAWWVEAENTPLTSAPEGGRFWRGDRRPSYAKMMEAVRRQGWLQFEGDTDEASIPCMCHD